MEVTDKTVTYTPEKWMEVLHAINHRVWQFRTVLKENQIDDKPSYISEWNMFYCDVIDQQQQDSTLTFDKVSQQLFGNPTTLQSFVTEALKLVPPITLVMKARKATNRKNVNITYSKNTDKITTEQLEVHKQYSPPNEDSDEDILKSASSEGINSEIRDRVKEMEEKLDRATIEMRNEIDAKMDGLKQTIPQTITTSVAEAIQQVFEQPSRHLPGPLVGYLTGTFDLFFSFW